MPQRLPLPLPCPVARRPTHPESASAMAWSPQRPAHPLSRVQFIVHTLRPFRMRARPTAGAERQVHRSGVVRARRGDNSLRGVPRTLLHSDASGRSIAEISDRYQLRRVQDQALNSRADTVRCPTKWVVRSSCKSSVLSQGTDTSKLIIVFRAVSSSARTRAAKCTCSDFVRVGCWGTAELAVR